ncbi:mitochondrial carrier domain-containing protein [Parachaetomium inaequale]|uniref:Mitochondrial carrier domain-containing protein n=1 Tax=Parachaetomium inaequale TaxID=2588326 RepID=A0AAN6PH68_9PEZI|nr:mitochondrial carrier domain-containing protein [Parachaetomium inaequale]
MQAAKSEGRPAAAPSAAMAKGDNDKAVASSLARPRPVHYPFWFGGSASSMAACVRLQTRTGDMPKSMSGTFVHILKHNGPRGLYNGLSASLLRQITYSTTRFGIYEELKSRFTSSKTDPDTGKPKPPSLPLLIAMASTSGFIGGIAGNAADVLNVRMQHDAALPPSQRRNYAHAVDGLARMVREEGFASLFRGVWPNSARAAAMTASQLASYDVFKRTLLRATPMQDNLATHFSASFLAGVVAATVTSPIDVIKTRVMSATGGDHGVVALLREVYAKEGMRWMFKGWVPSFLRLGPQTICTFLFLESHRNVYRKINGIEEPA